MPGSRFRATVTECNWLSPTVKRIVFTVDRPFRFEAGQFISVAIPASPKPIKRLYSLANGPEFAAKNGYELCIKHHPNGVGSGYLTALNPGDTFTGSAPYGDFQFRIPQEGRGLCFISIGTGVGPIKAIVESKLFQEHRPARCLSIFGARTRDEVIHAEALQRQGLECITTLSEEGVRVTDYLRSLPQDWNWHQTDFYLCGNPLMIQDVETLLRGGRGIPAAAIHRELFSFTPPRAPSSKTVVIQPKWTTPSPPFLETFLRFIKTPK